VRFTSSTRLNDVIPMGTQHRDARWGRARYAKDVLLLVSVELFPFRDITDRELLERATGEGAKGMFVWCSCNTDAMDQFMSASTIQFVPTNMTNRFEQVVVSVYAS
jgi:hypothetical protein